MPNYSFLFGDDVRNTPHQRSGPSTATSSLQSSGPQFAGLTSAIAGADLQGARNTLDEYGSELSEQNDSRFNVEDSLRHYSNAGDVRNPKAVGSDPNVGDAAPRTNEGTPFKVSSVSDYKRRKYKEARDRALSPERSFKIGLRIIS